MSETLSKDILIKKHPDFFLQKNKSELVHNLSENSGQDSLAQLGCGGSQSLPQVFLQAATPPSNTRLPVCVPLLSFAEQPGEAKETLRISKFKGKDNINFLFFFLKTAAVLLEKFTGVLLQMH